MIEQCRDFQLDGEPILCTSYGSGHINQTYLVVDATARQYILQKINGRVFRNREGLMKNIAAVSAHIGAKVESHRQALTLVPTLAGGEWLVDGAGEYWRMYEFISDSICMNLAETPDDFRESAVAFGSFQQQLADFPADTLSETIPRFHDTPNRYHLLRQALQADTCDRAKEAGPEIEFALEREFYASTLMALLDCGDLPLRVTHNDTKLNNVLFDRNTRRALCVIDLDTVMPGLSVNDFGDSIRFGASTALEDERDLSKVNFSMPLFSAYTAGYLSACRHSLTQCEIEHLHHGAKMMTLECGVRFLTDFLSGDTYFHTARPAHNLDRCRTQFKLVSEMERHWDAMERQIREEVSR